MPLDSFAADSNATLLAHTLYFDMRLLIPAQVLLKVVDAIDRLLKDALNIARAQMRCIALKRPKELRTAIILISLQLHHVHTCSD